MHCKLHAVQVDLIHKSPDQSRYDVAISTKNMLRMSYYIFFYLIVLRVYNKPMTDNQIRAFHVARSIDL
jgi:uncharacterized phage-associated protein